MRMQRVAKLAVTAAACCLMTSISGAAAQEFVGNDRLVSATRMIYDTGQAEDMFGKKPSGLLIFSANSEMRAEGQSVDLTALEHLLDQWATAWSSNDATKLIPLFTSDVSYEDVTFAVSNQGSEALREFASGTFASFADLNFELKSRFVSADGKWGAIEWVWRGRQIKDFPGLPATNKPFQVRGASVVEFREGKISRDADYWDLATYMRQVGLAK
jgi:steroid delta-isomerase-like uncharacterized protein